MFSDSGSLHTAGVELVTDSSHRPNSFRGRSDVDLEGRLPGFMRVTDWVGVCGIGFLVDWPFVWHGPRPLAHSLGIVLGATITANYLHLINAYFPRSWKRPAVQGAKASIAWIGAFGTLVSLAYLTDQSQEFIEPWAGTWFVSTWLYLVAARCAVHVHVARWQKEGRLLRNVAVLGIGPEAGALARRLRTRADEARVVGVFIDGNGAAGDGDIDRLLTLVSTGEVDEIIFTLPWSSPKALSHAIGRFTASQVELRLDPGILPADYPPQEFCMVAGVPTLTVQRRPLSGWGSPMKRAEDLLIATLMLMLLAPLLLAIAVIVKLDSRGPVFFRQERYGFNNNRIMVWKFRTMRHDPNPDPSVPQARRNDPRVTRVGAILRQTSLDELPQLLNVLKGNMSLVGPRPHAAAHNEKYARLIDGYLSRHRMKPGITGWAQVNGARGETVTTEQMKRRLNYDLFYIANWSVLLDFKVLLMTVPAVASTRNAW